MTGLGDEEFTETAVDDALVKLVGDRGVSSPGRDQALLGQLGQGLPQTANQGAANRVVVNSRFSILEAVPVTAQQRNVPVVNWYWCFTIQNLFSAKRFMINKIVSACVSNNSKTTFSIRRVIQDLRRYFWGVKKKTFEVDYKKRHAIK